MLCHLDVDCDRYWTFSWLYSKKEPRRLHQTVIFRKRSHKQPLCSLFLLLYTQVPVILNNVVLNNLEHKSGQLLVSPICSPAQVTNRPCLREPQWEEHREFRGWPVSVTKQLTSLSSSQYGNIKDLKEWGTDYEYSRG